MRLSLKQKLTPSPPFTGLHTETLQDPVVLLHGFGSAGIGWWPVAVPLSQDFEVWAPDLPGHGDAVDLFTEARLDAFAEPLERAAVGCGINSVHLVGHSLGGAVALALLERGRLPVRSLTLIAPAGCGPLGNPGFFPAYLAARTVEEMMQVLAQSVPATYPVTPRMARTALATVQGPAAPCLAAIVDAWRNEQLNSPLEGLARHAGPFTLIWGAEDQIAPPAHATRLRAHAEAEVLPGIGHLPHIEQPGLVESRVRHAIGEASKI